MLKAPVHPGDGQLGLSSPGLQLSLPSQASLAASPEPSTALRMFMARALLATGIPCPFLCLASSPGLLVSHPLPNTPTVHPKQLDLAFGVGPGANRRLGAGQG